MANLSRDEFRKNTEGKTMEDVVEKIKSLPLYHRYEERVKEGKESRDFLQMITFLMTFSDDAFHAMMASVSSDLMFSMIDLRLRNEILSEEGVENE